MVGSSRGMVYWELAGVSAHMDTLPNVSVYLHSAEKAYMWTKALTCSRLSAPKFVWLFAQ